MCSVMTSPRQNKKFRMSPTSLNVDRDRDFPHVSCKKSDREWKCNKLFQYEGH